jgi:uncharacterized protein YjbI with pentapeptide repeats
MQKINRQQLFDLYQSGIRDFRETDFTGNRLDYMDLRNCNFSKCDFTNVDLTGSNLAGTNFYRAIMDGATLKGVKRNKKTDFTKVSGNFVLSE